MKYFYNTFFISLFFITSIHGQIYVDAAAAGANDGSSWENAYTDLNNALISTTASDIWIAKATYFPPMQGDFRYFEISVAHNLYGGFSGTETSIDQRDIEANPTIIMGDINGDDDSNDNTLNRTDNALHLLSITAIDGTVVIDGISFQNGSALIDPMDDISFNIRGAGIYSLATLDIDNCSFSHHHGEGGSSIYLSGEGSNSTIDNSLFNNNSSTSQAAGILVDELNNVEINSCAFNNNLTNRGAVYARNSVNTTIRKCSFDSNEAITDAWCAGVFCFGSYDSKIDSCEFKNLTAANATAMYIDARGLVNLGVRAADVSNCSFDNINSTGFGGGVRAWMCDYVMDNCSFTNCIAGNTGSCIFNSGLSTYMISNTSFTDCVATFGGATSNYSSSVGTYSNCVFENNQAVTSGGASTTGFLADASFNNCMFQNNNALFGGALFSQNDTTRLSINGSIFNSNVASNNGGAICTIEGGTFSIDSSNFNMNSGNIGGAISFGTDTSGNGGFDIDKSSFLLNIASAQGGAINIFNNSGSITSSLIAGNAVSSGNGGGISQNAFSGITSDITITNTTIADNSGTPTAGIAQFEDEGDGHGEAILSLRNTILFNLAGPDYGVEAGEPTLVSLGGNLAFQDDLTEVFVEENDDLLLDPLFTDASNLEYDLKLGSPAINRGVVTGAHNTDILGNEIVGMPDKGAYESADVMSSLTEQVEAFDEYFRILQNPADDKLRIQVIENIQSEVQINIVSLTGGLVNSRKYSISGKNDILELDLQELAAGNYIVMLRYDKETAISKFVKI